MKLLSKTSLLIITASIFIFWAGNIVFFQVTRNMISSQINSDLMERMSNYITTEADPAAGHGEVGYAGLVSVSGRVYDEPVMPSFSDTVLYSSAQNRYITHRALTFSGRYGDGFQRITLYKSLLSSDRLIERISLASIILLIAFIVMIFVLNRFIFSNVWSEFSDTLQRVSNYNFRDPGELQLAASEIDEFVKLNSVLVDMADRISHDYRNLKELTANTSHEIQTPLAIIKNKAEMLLQSKNLKREEMEIVTSILNTTGRLSKLNQSLLLIARIENKQFEESEPINLDEALHRYIDGLEGLLAAGAYTLRKDIQAYRLTMNPVLLDILISNLLKNAISHGTRGTEVAVRLADGVLSVANHGDPLPFPPEEVFRRFTRGKSGAGSTGIGLEIVRKVCNYYNIVVQYSRDEEMHNFVVDFRPLGASSRVKRDKN